MSRPRVEILYFDGCPNNEPTRTQPNTTEESR